MKRWLVASAMFFCSMFVLLALATYRIYQQIPTGQATGFIAYRISAGTLLVILVATIVLGAFAVWLFGRLVR